MAIKNGFARKHRRALLIALDHLLAHGDVASDTLSFVHSVTSEWRALPEVRRTSRIKLSERAFWFAIYQLEELAELAGQPQHDSYRRHQIGIARKLRKAIVRNAPLPRGCFASPPGEIRTERELHHLLGTSQLAPDEDGRFDIRLGHSGLGALH